MIPITATLAIDDREVEERFVRASGPGGQNVNKVSTAVQLRFDVNASSLPDEVKTRRGSRFGGGYEAVDARKRAKLRAVAEAFLVQHPVHGDVRFDVASVSVRPDGSAIVELFEDAF